MSRPDDTSVLEMRPAESPGRQGRRSARADDLLTARTALRIDEGAGTLTWISEKAAAGDVVMSLPGRASAGRPAVARLCWVAVARAPFPSHQLIFVGQDGRCLARSARYYDEQFHLLWPSGRLEQLNRFGIVVDHETVRSPRALQQQFPGAAPRWVLQSPGILATLIVTALFLAAGLALAVYLLTG